MNAVLAPPVDESSPWLGLASFTEETRQYFHGRDEEVAELGRRVQRKLLTVLFGQSGLGKTSILRAGLVPRLRGEGYCPVYVRIDYGKDAPEPAEQIKQAILRTASHSGEWTQSGVAIAGESLWEFLHHRDDVLRDENGETLVPLLIFDQFEEIFTLAQSDEFGRARAARFIAELADLVENRAPKEFEELLERDDSAAERFDFARSDYRVLIALREDYLAPLESLKKNMPSIAQNRLRLAPMTGSQAFAAVSLPGRKLVSEEVAAAIVRFVAGGAELANAEVEPSLLSLICRELNDARIAEGRSEISLDLLEGSHATILSNFYERALADQPATVRRIIEDDLLTESGFRENVAEENLLRRLSAGAAPDTLATLVNRRLLRIEERLDIRRVELTHDVLCSVVKASRDQRHAREAQEAAERSLIEQKERALATRRALIRARKIASACIVLAIVAVGAAVYGYIGSQRAQQAEKQAQETRGQAEHLLGYLMDDFIPELSSFGRLDVIAAFTKRQIDYFRALPPQLRGTESTRNGALALIYHSFAMGGLGDNDTAYPESAEAIKLLEDQRQAGDKSEATTLALARGYHARARILSSRQDPQALSIAIHSNELLKPLAQGSNAAKSVRRFYVESLTQSGYLQAVRNDLATSISTLQQATSIAAASGGQDASDLDMAGAYVDAAGWLVSSLAYAGRNDEGIKAGQQALQAADHVLARRPGFRQVLKGKEIIEGALGVIAGEMFLPAAALEYFQRAEATAFALYNIDPDYTTYVNNLGATYGNTADMLWALGRVKESVAKRLQAVECFHKAVAGGEFFVQNYIGSSVFTAIRQAELGDYSASAATASLDPSLATTLRALEPEGGFATAATAVVPRIAALLVAYDKGDAETSYQAGSRVLKELQAKQAKDAGQQFNKDLWIQNTALRLGRSAYMTGRYAEAEPVLRLALKTRINISDVGPSDTREIGAIASWLAMSLARQGKTDDAAKIIAPYVTKQRDIAAKNHGDVWVPLELASVLYAQALSDPKQRNALLKEAAVLLDGVPASLSALGETRRWRDRIQQARNGK